MPFYEYQCQACGEELEVLQKMSESPLEDCPACNQSALQKKISAAGFRLKGGGWYETDFKNSKQRNLAQSGQESAKDSGKKTKPKPAKAEKKPAKAAKSNAKSH